MSELRLENVGYRYKNGDRDVLRAVTCTFEPGNAQGCFTGISFGVYMSGIPTRYSH